MKRRLSQVDTPSLSLQNSGEKPILVAKQEGNVEQQQQQQVSLFDNRPQMTEFDMLAVLAIAELASSARNGDDDNNNNEVLDSDLSQAYASYVPQMAARSMAASSNDNRMYTDGALTPLRKLSVDLSSITPARKVSVDEFAPSNMRLLNADADGASSVDGSSRSSSSNNSTIVDGSNNNEDVRRCAHCYTTQTPQWRRHTHGILLCNGCGLKARRKERRRERTRLADSTTSIFIATASTELFLQQQQLLQQQQQMFGAFITGGTPLILTNNNNNSNVVVSNEIVSDEPRDL